MPNIEPAKTPAPPARPRDLFTSLRDEMDRVFERFDRGWPMFPNLFARGADVDLLPDFDVRDDGKSIIIEAELPGVEEKDVSVTFANGILTVKGEKKQEREEKKGNYYVAERSYGSFERSLRMPDSVDEGKVEARFDKGVLKITAPKRPEAVKTERKIEIKKT